MQHNRNKEWFDYFYEYHLAMIGYYVSAVLESEVYTEAFMNNEPTAKELCHNIIRKLTLENNYSNNRFDVDELTHTEQDLFLDIIAKYPEREIYTSTHKPRHPRKEMDYKKLFDKLSGEEQCFSVRLIETLVMKRESVVILPRID